MNWQLAAALALGYGQLIAAQDTLRLFVWAAPVFVLAAVHVIPLAWMPLAILVTAVHKDTRA